MPQVIRRLDTGEDLKPMNGNLILPAGGRIGWVAVLRSWGPEDFAEHGLELVQVPNPPRPLPPPSPPRDEVLRDEIGRVSNSYFNSAVVLALAEITGKTREETLDWLAAKLA